MSTLSFGIAGAGLLGRLLAWCLCRHGQQVHIFDPNTGPQARFDGQQPAGFTAAGMLSPLAEMDNSSAKVAEWGQRSISLWSQITKRLTHQNSGLPIPNQLLQISGSLLLAHRSDAGMAQRVLARLQLAPKTIPGPQALSATELSHLEPALQTLPHAWLLPQEGHIDTINTMNALYEKSSSAIWHWQQSVDEATPGKIHLKDGSCHSFDHVFDVRGVGARPELPVRGVRGELIWLYLPQHGLNRPVRLIHPRHRIYMVPRNPQTLLIGASEIESEDRSPVSVRTAIELMTAAHSIMPGLSEARIQRMDVNLRPALPDNEPIVQSEIGLTRINGLFRHGWLLGPALVKDALLACALPFQLQD